ncbi:HET-domain-containing protein [Hyaloscypha bicolor E]|uniref:HET-domain-containing protein n=1 Tax=Hyaloscypha bicolor E TaxID=1095630 RepID=A0A2J6SNB6_9HELO|nr:HET-domain-containing protein [Hyaloscypha bicolor E]PMD52210.1 HET-domain-containing protein [Hyaloscypha bicolor E]
MKAFRERVLGGKSPKDGQASNVPLFLSQRLPRDKQYEPVLSDSRTTVTEDSLYRPLDFDSFEIRLLKFKRVEPRPLGFKPRLTCSLEYASLINPPDYIALSYCWGNATKTKKITINNYKSARSTQATLNLYEALDNVLLMNHNRRTGTHEYEDHSVLVWVDALCINQEDPVERSQQVRQMRQIYSRASEVISWIPCGSEQAVDYLVRNRFQGEGIETEVQLPSRKRTNSVPVNGSNTENDDMLLKDKTRKEWVNQGWDIMEDFFIQAYWRRVWVIQEVAVATKVKVLCGSYEIPWEDVAAVLAMWKKNPDIVPIDKRAYLKAMHLVEFRDRFQVKREPISLLDAMRWSYQTEATDPRDKIFALLGLCHDGATYVPVPNYKQPLEEIIADMSKSMMSFDRSLDLMCLKGTALEEQSNLPSWTPNWVNLWSGSLHSMTVHEAKFADWRTTFPSNPVLNGSTTQILKVEGKFYGTVAHLASKMAQPGPNGQITLTPEARAPWISCTSSLVRNDTSLSVLQPGDIEIRDSIWMTLTMGLLPPEISRSAAAVCFSQLWTPEGRGRAHAYALIEWIDRNSRFEVWARSLRDWGMVRSPAEISLLPAAVTSSEIDWKSLGTFIDTIEKVLGSGMRLVFIHGVKSFAVVMVPSSARRNDQMWFIRGCSVPVLLREVENVAVKAQYKVIGGVYVTERWREFIEYEIEWPESEQDEQLGLEGDLKILNLC